MNHGHGQLTRGLGQMHQGTIEDRRALGLFENTRIMLGLLVHRGCWGNYCREDLARANVVVVADGFIAHVRTRPGQYCVKAHHVLRPKYSGPRLDW